MRYVHHGEDVGGVRSDAHGIVGGQLLSERYGVYHGLQKQSGKNDVVLPQDVLQAAARVTNNVSLLAFTPTCARSVGEIRQPNTQPLSDPSN